MDKHIPPQAPINRSRRETIQPQQDMGEQDTMKNKVKVTIEIGEKPIKVIGELDELLYDPNYPTLTLDLKNVKVIEDDRLLDK